MCSAASSTTTIVPSSRYPTPCPCSRPSFTSRTTSSSPAAYGRRNFEARALICATGTRSASATFARLWSTVISDALRSRASRLTEPDPERPQHEEHEQRRRPGEGDRDEQQRQAEQRGDHEPGHEADDPARDLCRRAS